MATPAAPEAPAASGLDILASLMEVCGRGPDVTFCGSVGDLPEAAAARVLCRLETAPEGTFPVVTPWAQAMDRYYETPGGRTIRTTTTTVPDGTVQVSHTVDTPLAVATLGWPSDEQDLAAATAATATDTSRVAVVSVRFSRAVNPSELQDRVDATLRTCIRQVRTFTRTSAATRARWTVEVTLSWAGKACSEPLLALRAGQRPKMSLRLLGTRLQGAVQLHGAQHMAVDAAIKLADILGFSFEAGAQTPAMAALRVLAPLQRAPEGVLPMGDCAAGPTASAPAGTSAAPGGTTRRTGSAAAQERVRAAAAAAAAALGQPLDHFW
jgi:hypothetical protein